MPTPDEQREEIIDVMFPVPCAEGKVVIAQGDVGDNFYIVDSGEYEVFLKQKGDEKARPPPEGRRRAGGALSGRLIRRE